MKSLCVDLRGWGQIVVTGEDRAQFLHGMCTSDIAGLEEGGTRRASILTAIRFPPPKGNWNTAR